VFPIMCGHGGHLFKSIVGLLSVANHNYVSCVVNMDFAQIWNNRNKSTMCQLCDLYRVENVPHKLFVYWNIIRMVAPQDLVQDMMVMMPNELEW
jgi:hypothetical protein